MAAEAYRYKVTGSAEALANVNNAIQAIKIMIDVTGSDVLSRCALPADSPYAAAISSEEAPNGVYQGTVYGAPWIWIGNTSRDSYSGVFFGLAVTYDMVSDQTVRNWVSYLATRLLNNLLDNFWNIVLPDGSISTTFLIRPDQQLSLLLVGTAREWRPLRHEVLRRVERAFADGAGAGGNRLRRRDRLVLQVQPGLHQPLHAEAAGQRLLEFLVRAGVRRAALDDGWPRQRVLQHDRSRRGQSEYAARRGDARPAGRLARSARARTSSAISPASFRVCGDDACKPLPVQDRVTTDFLWQRSPFQLAGGGNGDIETAGIDYILPYWMAPLLRRNFAVAERVTVDLLPLDCKHSCD